MFVWPPPSNSLLKICLNKNLKKKLEKRGMSFRRYFLFYYRSISELGKEGYFSRMNERLPDFFKDYAYVSGFTAGFFFVTFVSGSILISAYMHVEPDWTSVLPASAIISLQAGIFHPIAYFQLGSLVTTGIWKRKEIMEMYVASQLIS